MNPRPTDAAKPSAWRLGVRFVTRPFGVNGIDLKRLLRSLRFVPRYLRDLGAYSAAQTADPAFRIRWRGLYPCLADYADPAGGASGHYFHQDLYFARKIFQRRPARHVDIGSRVDGFVAHLLCFMPVECVDVRPIASTVEGLSFVQSDATTLAQFPDASIGSISTLHAAEHFGLGRYGDPIDPQACFRFMASLERVLAPGGRLYFSVPVGRERLEFNAHRVFAPATILKAFADLRLVSFAVVLDDGTLHPDVPPERCDEAQMACGLFEFTKD